MQCRLYQASGRRLRTCIRVGLFVLLSVVATTQWATPGTTPLPELSYRSWSSASGETVEAAFINLQQGQLVLKARTGKRIVIPMRRLVWRDQITARRMAGLPATGQGALFSRLSSATTRRAAEARVLPAFGADCENLLTNAIGGARHEILIAIYTLTSETIAEALLQALERGVTIQVKYDAKQIETGRMQEWMSNLQRKGASIVPVEVSGWYASMHHKFCVIDQASVFTGSYNFTVSAATTNYENAVLIQSDTVAAAFTQEFERIQNR